MLAVLAAGALLREHPGARGRARRHGARARPPGARRHARLLGRRDRDPRGSARPARRVPGGVRRTGDDAGARRRVLGGARRHRRGGVRDRRVPVLALVDLRRAERAARVPARRWPDAARRRLGHHEGPPARATGRGMVRRAGSGWRSGPSPSGRSANGDVGLGIFTGYIALILVTTGRGMDQRIALRDRLEQGHVGDAMRPPPPTILATIEPGRGAGPRPARHDGPAVPRRRRDGRFIGSVSMRSARRLGGRDPLRPVSDALIPLNQTTVLDRHETLDGAFEWLGGQDGLVVDDGKTGGDARPERRRGVVPTGDRGPLDPDRASRRCPLDPTSDRAC